MMGRAYAAGTILNALATGIGCAFGIDLDLKVKIKSDSENTLVVNGEKRNGEILKKILSHFDEKFYVVVRSRIPERSGLGSSSAFLNALLSAMMKRHKELSAAEILKLNADISLKAGMSYTGAFDDASASLLGGFVISDNYRRKLRDWFIMRKYVAILIPEFKRGHVDWEKIKKESYRLRNVDIKLKEHKFCEVMIDNTKFYCEMIGYPKEIAERLWKENVCCGLSGNGPAYVAFGEKDEIVIAKEIWSDYGEVLIKKVPEKPSENVIITQELFIDNQN
ncbi:MAG: shikimate kinase [Archaeoglobaceae archaeon]|nr:shikimate kinase [Archaeoglobaceae archaeon]